MWNIYLLSTRIWLGYIMITGGQSILRFFSSQNLRDFFQNWFGNELGIPFPLFSAFIAKGTELIGGILVTAGLFTRISSALIAIDMLAATLIANIDYTGKEGFLRQDGTVTVSSLLFAIMLLFTHAGKYSFDNLLFKKGESKLPETTQAYRSR